MHREKETRGPSAPVERKNKRGVVGGKGERGEGWLQIARGREGSLCVGGRRGKLISNEMGMNICQ